MTAVEELYAAGRRVVVRTARHADLEPYRRAVEASRDRLSRWNPVDPGDLVHHLAAQSENHRTFLVVARDAEGSHGVVGKVNVVNVVRGRFGSGVLGYDAYDPYAGRGLFREGLALVVGLALHAAGPDGMGLHRLEANVQPGNSASAGVLRALGFRHEGETPRMLYLDGPGGQLWRDHERYAITVEEWPATPYAPHLRARRVLLVHGADAGGRRALSERLAAELVLPLLVDSAAAAGGDSATWDVLGRCPTGAVVDGSWGPQDRDCVAAGLRRAGVDPRSVVEVRCGSGASGKADHGGAPLGLGRVLTVDPSVAGDAREVTRVALQARALTVSVQV